METPDERLERFRRWKELLAPYQFSGEYGDYNNDGVITVMDELDELIKSLEASPDTNPREAGAQPKL